MGNPLLSEKANQLAEFIELNTGHYFPDGIEGYWRPGKELPSAYHGELYNKPFLYWQQNKIWQYPFPVVYEPEGYDKNLFLIFLRELQESPYTKKVPYRGYSKNRLTGESNGNVEYERDDWKWPQGYINYIEAGVPPSRAFYKFVTGLDCRELPPYRESQNE